MTQNPYAAPAAEVRDTLDAFRKVTVYSPRQVACGTIGGPVGLIYFLRANFSALGNHRAAQITLMVGLVLVPVVFASGFFLPEDFPGFPFAIVYALSALYVSSKYQMTKQAIADSALHTFHSNWRVFGIGLVSLLVSAILLIVPVLALSYFGVG